LNDSSDNLGNVFMELDESISSAERQWSMGDFRSKHSILAFFRDLFTRFAVGRMEGWKDGNPIFHPSIRAGFLLSSVKSFWEKFEICPNVGWKPRFHTGEESCKKHIR